MCTDELNIQITLFHIEICIHFVHTAFQILRSGIRFFHVTAEYSGFLRAPLVGVILLAATRIHQHQGCDV